jgi:zinc D-Ala-D-Ala carboxypeptidase
MSELSKYFTLELVKKSSTATREGIDNTPNAEQIQALTALGLNVYDKVKDQFPDCFTNSIFRSKALNDKIKGSLKSQHCKGEAVDIDRATNKQNVELFKWIKDNLEFDQLIAEFCDDNGPEWVHVSFTTKGKNRKMIETAEAVNGEKTGAGASYKLFTGKEKWYK